MVQKVPKWQSQPYSCETIVTTYQVSDYPVMTCAVCIGEKVGARRN